MYEQVYLCFINVEKGLLNKTGWGNLYAAYPCIENKASFIYPLEKAKSDALVITFWGQEIQRM